MFSINSDVNSIQVRRFEIEELLTEISPDILAVQEIKILTNKRISVKGTLVAKKYIEHANMRSMDVAQ